MNVRLEKIQEDMDKILVAHQFFKELQTAAYDSAGAADVARIKMKYAREEILKVSMEVKELLQRLEQKLLHA